MPRDRGEHEAGIDLGRDLGGGLLEQVRAAKRSPRALLLVAIRGRYDSDDEQHEADHDPLTENGLELERRPAHDEHDLLRREGGKERGGGDEDALAAEPE